VFVDQALRLAQCRMSTRPGSASNLPDGFPRRARSLDSDAATRAYMKADWRKRIVSVSDTSKGQQSYFGLTRPSARCWTVSAVVDLRHPNSSDDKTKPSTAYH
jgi:hypothetical protein